MFYCPKDHVTLKNMMETLFYCPKDHVTLKIVMGTLYFIVLRIMLH